MPPLPPVQVSPFQHTAGGAGKVLGRGKGFEEKEKRDEKRMRRVGSVSAAEK